MESNGLLTAMGAFCAKTEQDSDVGQVAPDVLMRESDSSQNHGCGLGLDGMIDCWAKNAFGTLSPPACDST
jgi:hypothetical protein